MAACAQRKCPKHLTGSCRGSTLRTKEDRSERMPCTHCYIDAHDMQRSRQTVEHTPAICSIPARKPKVKRRARTGITFAHNEL